MDPLYMELLEACRAGVAAQRAGETDPMGYIRDVLERHGQLPPNGMTPAQCLALAVA